MNNILYELTCPHCGQKYTYAIGASDPALNTLPKCCDCCGQTEPIKDYFRMNCLSDEKEGIYTVTNCQAADINQPFGNKQEEGMINEINCDTVVSNKPIMTIVNKNLDPHIFHNPATLINPFTGESLTMAIGEQTVGRDAPIEGPNKGFHNVPKTVSRRHICITTVETGDGYFINLIMNCNNTNHTLLNGKELPAGAIWKLAKGMKLTMGELTVIVEDI